MKPNKFRLVLCLLLGVTLLAFSIYRMGYRLNMGDDLSKVTSSETTTTIQAKETFTTKYTVSPENTEPIITNILHMPKISTTTTAKTTTSKTTTTTTTAKETKATTTTKATATKEITKSTAAKTKKIAETTKATTATKATSTTTTTTTTAADLPANEYIPSNQEMEMFCTVVSSETGYCEDKAQKAVAHTVLNRLASDIYPDTLYEVLTQRNQYSCVNNYFYGTYRKGLAPGSDGYNHTMKLIKEAMEEYDFTNGAVAYYNPKINGYNSWFEQYELVYEDEYGRFFIV